jgi:hypothetical protein
VSDLLSQLGSGTLGTLLRFVVIMTGLILTYRRSGKAKESAETAAERSLPTANGYTVRTEAALARIETGLSGHDRRLVLLENERERRRGR